MEGMYHSEILSSFLLWGKGTNKMASIKMICIYHIYRIYFVSLRKREIMEATVTHRRKIIDLKEDTFKALSVMAARQGTNLKKLIENLLDKTAEEYDVARLTVICQKTIRTGRSS